MSEEAYRIEWRPRARKDLDAIVRYIAEDDVGRAEAFAKTLSEKTQVLALHPQLGRRGRPGLPDYVREFVAHPNYIVFFRVHSESKIVEILRLKHVAQRIP